MTGSARRRTVPSSSLRKRRRSFISVLAADVFVYCGDLAPIAAAVARVMAPGGLFAFTVESHDGSGISCYSRRLRYRAHAEVAPQSKRGLQRHRRAG